jgi:glycerol dehydrogenase-like iron-containing ADH family enzyme
MGTIPEADLRASSDGVIVAFHDDNFARLVKDANEELKPKGVADLTWAELADSNTYAAAGKAVMEVFRSAGQPVLEPFLFSNPDLYAESGYVTLLEEALSCHEAIPVAVGSGTINDLTKQAKDVTAEQLEERLQRLRQVWPETRSKLQKQLLAPEKLRRMLHDAGAPTAPEQIGISRERLRLSYWQATRIRRRYTVLDLALETGPAGKMLQQLFAAEGFWNAG